MGNTRPFMRRGAWLIALQLILLVNSVGGQVPELVLSSRWFHPKSHKDTLSTLEVIKRLKVDRIDWMYSESQEQLALLQKLDIEYSLALNPQIPDSNEYTSKSTRVVDSKGRPLVAPWMKTWSIKNPYWGCVNNPKFQQVFLKKTKKLVDLNAYGIFVDDARFNDHAVEWGGCYCDYCLRGFYLKQQILGRTGFDTPAADVHRAQLLKLSNRFRSSYLIYQRESVIKFLENWMSQVRTYAARDIVFITNNYAGKWNSIYELFDAGIAEMPARGMSLNKIAKVINDGKQVRKHQVLSFASRVNEDNIIFMLFCYLKGAEALIPWDIWLNDNPAANQRFYISTSNILPITDLISSKRELFYNNINERSVKLEVRASILGSTFTTSRKARDGASYVFALSELNSNEMVKVEIKKDVKYTVLAGRRELLNEYDIVSGRYVIVRIQ